MGFISGKMFIGDDHFGKPHVFIRKIYKSIVDGIKKEPKTHYIITGNPGIVKSLFGMYLFHILVKEKKAVEYNDSDMHFFNERDPKFLILDLPSYKSVKFSITDSSPCHIILFSPGKDKDVQKRFRPIIKPGSTFDICKLNMQVWNENELMEAAEHLKLDKASVSKRFQLFGGIPLYCFYGCMLTEQDLSQEVAKLTLSQITTIDKDINLGHRIFHRFCTAAMMTRWKWLSVMSV